ncbi:Protein of unknown function (DUF3048) [Promicromonospora sp. AC04]|uniref:DUF3048 domain-containing protein n=1 Tax=Promicromonospora sp. AC04 TaxID=2135723 RepID=UPI000D4BE5DB|nr:DUF3048 domain-containing protein [Promicromonospora sp. AC04]PUB30194.1 Protein of unknown function (DUF3048) [Promicromonospora sp. AC04]
MTTRRTTAVRATGAALVIMLGLAACGLVGPEVPSPTPTATVDAPVESDRTGPPKPPKPPAAPVVWPLTGVRTDKIANRPAVSVKIENSSDARPQRGLVEADIVWEEVVEGGISRFVATYHSNIPDIVEPVRSVRPMDPAIVGPLDGILVFSGGQGPFIAATERVGTQTIIMDKGDAGFTRDSSRYAPHNVIGSMPTFLAQADGRRTNPPRAQFKYAPKVGQGTARKGGTPAHVVDVRLSPAQRTVWTWDQENKRYLRSEGSAASVAADGRRHSARNVLVLSTHVFNTKWVDPSGAPVPEHKLAESSGVGTLVSTGRSIPVRWSKKDLLSPIVLKTRDGQDVRLDPGNTWIELVPAGSGSWSVR